MNFWPLYFAIGAAWYLFNIDRVMREWKAEKPNSIFSDNFVRTSGMVLCLAFGPWLAVRVTRKALKW